MPVIEYRLLIKGRFFIVKNAHRKSRGEGDAVGKMPKSKKS